VQLDGEEFARAIGDLRTAVELHAEEEEEVLFPRLEGALDSGALRQLGVSMMALYHAKVEAGYADRTPSSSMLAEPPSPEPQPQPQR
jgi:hypothetical protein